MGRELIISGEDAAMLSNMVREEQENEIARLIALNTAQAQEIELLKNRLAKAARVVLAVMPCADGTVEITRTNGRGHVLDFAAVVTWEEARAAVSRMLSGIEDAAIPKVRCQRCGGRGGSQASVTRGIEVAGEIRLVSGLAYIQCPDCGGSREITWPHWFRICLGRMMAYERRNIRKIVLRVEAARLDCPTMEWSRIEAGNIPETARGKAALEKRLAELPRYKEFRADGWPICPQCGEDELWSPIFRNITGQEPRPTVEECRAGVMNCYKCHWTSEKRQ